MSQTSQVSSVPPQIVRRNRVYFVFGSILTLAIGGTFAWGAHKALVVRSLTGSEFATYVVDHHVGTVAVSDDASGFQGDFAVLTLNHPYSESSLLAGAKQMAWQYYNLDGGINLSIEYRNPATHKTEVQASTLYLAQNHSLSINLRGPNLSKSVVEKVTWPDNGGS